VKLTSLLDEALDEYIAQAGLTMTNSYRADFNGKINFLSDGGYLRSPSKLHELRNLRNAISHEFNGHGTWERLDTATETANAEMQHLGFGICWATPTI
jgi:hypothetical protein